MKLPQGLGGEQLAKALQRFGYQRIGQRGSHIHLVTQRHGRHRIAVPAHSAVKREKTGRVQLMPTFHALAGAASVAKGAGQVHPLRHAFRPCLAAVRLTPVHAATHRFQLRRRLRRVDLLSPVPGRPPDGVGQSLKTGNSSGALPRFTQRQRLPQRQSSARSTSPARSAFRST